MTNAAVANPSVPLNRQRISLGRPSWMALAFCLGLAPLHARAVQPSVAPDRDSFLRAVAEVETGGNPRAVGRRGERGLYQFSFGTWQRYTAQPFHSAHDPIIAHDIAVRHFEWLQDQLRAGGRKPTAFQLAVAWNSGLNRALSGRYPKSTRDYAGRVANLSEVYARSITRPSAGVAAMVASATPAAGGTPVAYSDFKLGDVLVGSGSSAPALGAIPPTTAAELSFNLDRPESRAAPSETKAEGQRFIFATVGH